MLEFIRSDLASINSYTPNPRGKTTQPLDRLNHNEVALDLPLELKEKLAKIYRDSLATNRYPDGSHKSLKEAIAAYANSSGSLNDSITPENISVGNGSDELIRSILISTCLGGQGAILVANPTFSMYGILAETLGIKVASVGRSNDNFSIDLAAAQLAIEKNNNPPVRVVFAVHPNSPTGNLLTPQELEWLRNLPESILVVVDEAYFEFSQTSVISELAQHPNWSILRTFSKAFRLAALRVGYAIAHPQLINVLEKTRLPYNLPGFSQIAAGIVLENRDLLLPLIEDIVKEKERIFKILADRPDLEIWPSSANYLYLRPKIAEGEDQSGKLQQLTAALKELGTLIRYTGGGLRITIGTYQENNRTLERLQKLLDR